jgi:hypothetical protein
MKPTASYRMSGPTKTMLALGHFKTAEQRHGWKRAMIDAELTAEHAKKTAGKRSKEDRNNAKAD